MKSFENDSVSSGSQSGGLPPEMAQNFNRKNIYIFQYLVTRWKNSNFVKMTLFSIKYIGG